MDFKSFDTIELKQIEHIKEINDNLFKLHQTDMLPPSHIQFLEKLKTSGINPKVCYDIGSNVLHWTKHANRIWTDTQIILFDAFDHAPILYEQYSYPYEIVVLSDQDDKEVKFYQNDIFIGGSSYYKEYNDAVFPVDKYVLRRTKKLDTIVKDKAYPYPDLVKIDVQGAELDVIKGGFEVLSHAKYLIIELQHQEYNIGAPLANITKSLLESMGWICMEEKFSNNGPDADYFFIQPKNIK